MNHPYTTDPSDEARAVHMEIIHKMTPAERGAIALRMTNSTVRQSKAAIQRAFPDLFEDERSVKFIALHYGAELAENVRLKLLEKVE